MDQPNYTAMFASAYESGRAVAKSKGVQNALSIAQTDPAGAQGALMRYGAFDEANALGKVQDRQRAETMRTQAAPLIANKDYAGAQGVYAQNGEFDTAAAIGKLDDQQREHAAHLADVTMQALYGLRQLPNDPEVRKAGLMKIAPILLQKGLSQDDIDKAALGDLSDAGLEAAAASTMSLKDQLVALHQQAADAETARHNRAMENPVKYEKVTDGDGTEHLVQVGGGANGGAGQPAPTGQAPSGSAPRGIRNNNPLNLEATVQWNGMTGSDGRYAKFSNPADGWAAADRNLQTYDTKHGINTVAGVIERWTPAKENGAATGNEISTIAKQLGVDPNAPLNLKDPSVRRNLLEAMAGVENGQKVSWGAGQDMTGAPPAQGGQSGAKELWTGTPKPNEVAGLSPDAIENAALKYNSTGQMPSFGMGKSAIALKTAVLNRAAVLAAAEGTADGGVLRQSIVKGAQQALNQTMKSHAAVRRFAEAANQNADLVLSLAGKGAAPGQVPIINRWVQAGRKSIAGDADVTAFDSAIGGFSEEFAKVMTGSTGSAAATDSARHAAADRLSKYATQGQLAAGIATMRKEMANQEAALGDEEKRQQQVISTGGRAAVAGAADPTAPAVKAALPPAALAAHAAFMKSPAYNPKAKLGSQQNPYVARDDATLTALDKLHKGSWAIAPDGGMGQFR